jgi:16S rRNA (guanine1207-N2)-methyltransferase
MYLKREDDADHYFTVQPKSKLKLGLIRTSLRGKPFEFLTASGVFSMKRIDSGTRLLVESMLLPEKGCVLDVGCGYGAVGIAAADVNPRLRVVMVDVNERAVWLTRQNIVRNCISNAEVRNGCFYEPVDDLVFDCVLSNPPVSAGIKAVETIIHEAPEHMTHKALLQIVLRSKIAGKRVCSCFEKVFGNVEVLARESGYRVLMSRKQ